MSMARFVIDLSLSDSEILDQFWSHLAENYVNQISREYFDDQFKNTVAPRLSEMRVLHHSGSTIEMSKMLKFEGDELIITLNTEPLTFMGRLKKIFCG